MLELKVPPHDMEAEQSLIGAMFLKPKIVSEIMNVLEPDDFYRESNKYIVEAFFSLKESSDFVTIADHLKKHDLYEKVGGFDYLATFANAVSTTGQASYYASIIKNLSNRRLLITQCSETAEKSFKLTEDFEEILAGHKDSLKDFVKESSSYRDSKEILKDVYRDIEERYNDEYKSVGIETGFVNIDIHISGLEPKTTTYLIAKPSMGKTALSLNIADYVVTKYPGKVLFFSLESGDKALTRRRLSTHSQVFLTRIRSGDLEEHQLSKIRESANVLSQRNLIIIDNPKFKTIESMVPLAESIGQNNKISLIVIDHIQRMRCRKKTQNRHLEVSYVSEEISSLANNLNIPILVLCQLRREPEGKKNYRPQLADMKESGDLEQNADGVWGLYREDKEAEETEITGLKGRDTGTWKTYLTFDRFIQKFRDRD